MNAYYFRFLNADKSPTGHVGMAVANDMVDLFLAIDQFGDPYSTEIRGAKAGAMCVLLTPIEDDGVNTDELELSEEFMDQAEDGKWVTPIWPAYTEIYGADAVTPFEEGVEA
jgi:hypothetical protein